MKFLACTHCLSMEADHRSSQQPIQEITNPLVVTKRPIPKTVYPRSSDKSSPPMRKRRFPSLLNGLTSWPRRRQTTNQKHSSPEKNVHKIIRVIEQPQQQQRRRIRRPPTRTQRLIRLYEERATSPDAKHFQPEEYLIDPPASFSGDDSLESHQNFKNKLNTLDFKRMNTVALEEPSPLPSRCESDSYGKNSFKDKELKALPISKFARKTLLEDFLQERLRIEQTMIDLLNGRDPGSMILKKSRNDDKKVRFKETTTGQQEFRVDVTGDKKIELKDDGSAEQQTEIKLCVDPMTKVEDFYIERKTVFLKDKTVEDKALVLKIAPKDEIDQRIDENTIGMRRSKALVFRDFGKLHL